MRHGWGEVIGGILRMYLRGNAYWALIGRDTMESAIFYVIGEPCSQLRNAYADFLIALYHGN